MELTKIGFDKFFKGNTYSLLRWEVTNLCNYKCWYCCHSENDLWDDVAVPKKDLLMRAAKNIIKYQEPLSINITGGEPTVISEIDEILLFLCSNMPNAVVEMVTNASKNIEWWTNASDKLKGLSNIAFTFSLHLTQVNDIFQFIEKMNILSKNGITLYINFMMDYNNFDLGIQYYNLLKQYTNPTYIYVKYLYLGIEREIYTQEQIDWIDSFSTIENRYRAFYSDGSEELLSIRDLKKRKMLTMFNGWKCLANHNWTISQLGQFRHTCDFKKNLLGLTKNNIFVNGDAMQIYEKRNIPIICDKYICDCIDDLGLIKWK